MAVEQEVLGILHALVNMSLVEEEVAGGGDYGQVCADSAEALDGLILKARAIEGG